MKGDTPVKRVSITEMTDDQISSFLIGIRERRLKAVQIFEDTQALRDQAYKLQLNTKFEHELKMFERERTQLAKVIEKVEKRVTGLRALQLQLEDS